jgi:eukaryotic-like serine/threonine-protein kinase
MPDPSPPPDSDLLRRFRHGNVTEDERARVAAYLAQHPEFDATRTAEPTPDGLSGSAPVAIVADSALTATAAADPNLAETADQDTRADHTQDIDSILSPAQQSGELGRLGRYRVLRVLGQGGMGVVFEAEDEALKRRVALKAMLPTVAANPAARKRFVREAETAAKVRDDYIVPIYDIAEANGVPFIAMPLLVGESLDTKLRSNEPLVVREVLTIGREVALGLAAAHEAGLIHRDIKPGNIWLERTAEGALKRALILDFGLARLTRDGSELTHSGAILGTPAYMAPEQARGQAVDRRADLFSLGCVLYQMATGRRPFLGADTYSVLSALATETPPPPIELNPAVPAGLSTLIELLLTKNPDHRWPPTAREVADELFRIGIDPASSRHALPGLPPKPPPPPPTDPSGSRPVEIQPVKVPPTEVLTPVPKDAPPKPAEAPAADPPKPLTRGWRKWVVVLAVLAGAVALGAVIYSGTLLRYVNNEGQLVVETDDPNIEVVVEQKDGTQLVHPTRERVFTVPVGDGKVDFYDPKTHHFALSQPYRVGRGGKMTVHVTTADIVAARELKNQKVGKPDPFTPELRKALQWVQSAGGIVRVRKGNEQFEVVPGKTFPDPPFTITDLDLDRGLPDVPDLEHLRGLPPVEGSLSIVNTSNNDIVWARLSTFPALRAVTTLRLGGPLNNGALEHLQHFPNLVSLDVRGVGITDEGLRYLERCPRLAQLDLRGTKVTKAAIERFAAPRPYCRIEYDGDIIEPTATGKPVDLLALVDTKRDTVGGRWTLADGKLTGGGTTVGDPWIESIQIPFVPPAEYDLVMVVQRTGVVKVPPVGGPTFSLTLTGPYRCQLIFDQPLGEKPINGLQLIDGKAIIANETRTEGDFFGKDGAPVVITCRVRKSGIVLLTDGQVRFKWRGDVRKLSHDDLLWKLPDKTRLALAVQHAEYRISEWKVYPVEAAPVTPKK